MKTQIVYKKSVNTWRTQKFGNLMRGGFHGELNQSSSGEWSGWVIDSDMGNLFKLGFLSRAAAARWVNSELRKKGV